MLLRVPSYYKDFSCIADRCKDSCCIGWEIDIDEDTLDYYKQIEGEFGERLRKNIKEGEQNSFTLVGKRCPFLNESNLCDICIHLGEESLCEICTEYPRFTLEYGNVREKCLGISCEEAGRLIFESSEKFYYEETYLSDGEDDEEAEIVALSKARDHVIAILQMRQYSIDERILLALSFAEMVQQDLNECNLLHIDSIIENTEYERVLERCSMNEEQPMLDYFKQRMECFSELEVLDKEWHVYMKKLKHFMDGCNEDSYIAYINRFMEYYKQREYEYEHLLCYFIFRYIMRAVYDSDFIGRVKFAAASFFMIRDMDLVRFQENGEEFTLEDRIDVARIYSKEVEHSEDNMEFLQDAFLFDDIFSVDIIQKQFIIGKYKK